MGSTDRKTNNLSPLFRAVSLLFFQFVFCLVLIFNSVVYSLSVHGRRHIKNVKGFIVSNHALYLDPAVIAQALYPKRAYFSVLQETFKVPGLALMIRLLGAFPVPEENTMRQLQRILGELLKYGGLIHFFPEGKLYPKNQQVKAFKPGVFFFAFHFNLPVIPMVTVITARKMFGREIRLLPPRLSVVIGRPIQPERFRKKGTPLREQITMMGDYVRKRMQRMIDRTNGRV